MTRILSLTLGLLLMSLHLWAVDIPQGTFYFDNSKTQYTRVKLVYGSDTTNETYVVSMNRDSDDLWKITMQSAATNMYRYTFANTTLADGKINSRFSTVKDDISLNRNEKRTATTSVAIPVGYVYTPSSSDNWASGQWLPKGGVAHPYSSTLPVLYINTAGNQPVTSKEVYLTGSYYLDHLGIEGYEPIGSKEVPLPIEIKGRGNYTWSSFEKKPYRIKLKSSMPLLNMTASKHFVLLAHADDRMAFLRNTVGFELSRLLGLPYTPSQQPVELMLNGEYKGLYFLTENIRVDAQRVNIAKQVDYETDAQAITGGWIVEIDNYDEVEQVRITEGNGAMLRFTYKTPELLSTQQRNYLTQQVTTIDNAIYNGNKNSTFWEEYVDINTLAKFYIVQEVMDNAESFHGSCYLYKDKGDARWYFGPVWDFGNSFHRGYNKFIYVDSPFGQNWIGEIAKYPRFQNVVKELWKSFKGNQFTTLSTFIDQFIDQIAVAAQFDARRWPQYGSSDAAVAKYNFMSALNKKTSWLVQQWGEGVTGLDAPHDYQEKIWVTANRGYIDIVAQYTLNRVKLYDTYGIVLTTLEPQATCCRIDCKSGIYLLEITCENEYIERQKVLVP